MNFVVYSSWGSSFMGSSLPDVHGLQTSLFCPSYWLLKQLMVISSPLPSLNFSQKGSLLYVSSRSLYGERHHESYIDKKHWCTHQNYGPKKFAKEH